MKTAVVLFNLGGPDSPEEVGPFLFSLFNDKAIVGLPQPFRYLVAKWLATSRLGAARKIYAQLGGRSPIVDLTRAQAAALQNVLSERGEYMVFVAMRHSYPLISDTVAEVKAYNPGKVVLLPLYPQYSGTTTGSAFAQWYAQAKEQGLDVAHHPVCCYPADNNFIEGHVILIRAAYEDAAKIGTPRVLFSAHGLPKKVIAKGDPYQWQVEKTVAAVMRVLGEKTDHVICYQSRVGPLKWLEPSTPAEIKRAGQDHVPVVVVPITFVSEHSETLVELDIEYKKLADEAGVPHYARVPALGVHSEFIETLSWLVEATKLYPNCSNSHGRICPKEFGKCGYREWKN